jgi:LemA protein
MNDIILLLFLLIGIVCILAFGWRTQNRLAPLRERVDEAASNIKVTIEKRNRLIKQLLDVAATYAAHERELHERISADFDTPSQVELNPTGAMAYVSRLVNTFPNLRADRTYLDLTNNLYTLESELQDKHQQHSAGVREYNSVRLSFPNDMFAWFGGFKIAEYLHGAEPSTPETRNVLTRPAVDLSKVVHPRPGMIFRDTERDEIWKIDGFVGKSKVFDKSITVSKIPKGGGGYESIDSWKEHVAKGRYRIE